MQDLSRFRSPIGAWQRCALVVQSALLLALGCVSCGSGGDDMPPACGPYPAQQTSPYVLPYQVGQIYLVSQGNCSSGSHSSGTLVQHAYDFLMPVGTSLIAARGGVVLLVEERFDDGSRTPGQENFVNIVHADDTIAAYVHLTRDGALVAVGDVVVQGELIGLSGDTGDSAAPHLHFHVQRCAGCETVPLTFRNTRAHPDGLVEGQQYTAEAF
ncbi:MAG TPA: M23 family metallopeptidase [Steroidobacteraceae bacterium]